MKPKNELTYLKTFIQLTEEQAVKRDMLETFLNNRDKILRLDADSLAYNVASFWIDSGKTPNLEDMYGDFHDQVMNINNRIEEDFNVTDIQYYFSKCHNNFRYTLSKEYKAERTLTPTKELARELVDYTIQLLESLGLYVDYSDSLEADDLCSIAAKEYGWKHSITVSPDKDLKQILGANFDYFKVKTGEVDVWDNDVKDYRGWSFASPQDSFDLFMYQMLVGDTSDGVKGAKNVGDKGAAKLLEGKTNFSKLLTVARAYRIYSIKDNNLWCQRTQKQHDKYKGEKRMVNDMKRMRLNVKLMRL